MVGTRQPTDGAARFARVLARELTLAGVTVASGGAMGIDAAAHRGALDAGGATLVVAPAGLACCYPAEHADLFEEVLQRGGCYLAPGTPETPATRAAFFARNAVLVALAHVVVVVEAPLRSGARNAARQARCLGRPLLVVPTTPWNRRGGGNLAELRGAARMCSRAEDVLAELRAVGQRPVPPRPPRRRSAPPRLPGLDGSDTQRVLRAAREGAEHVDHVVERTGLPVSRVLPALLRLSLRGAARVADGGRIKLITP